MSKSNGSVAKRTRTSGTRHARPKTAQSAVTRVSPEAIERFADAITRLFCAVIKPLPPEGVTGDEKPDRGQRGADYIAAIAEQRPGVEGHGYPGGYPDWDQSFRLFWSNDRSLILPDWMALPLVRQILNDPELRNQLNEQQDEPDEPDSGNIADA